MPRGVEHKDWNEVGQISGAFWYEHVVRSANGNKGRRSEIELTIDKEYAWNIFLEQDGKCAFSGIELKFLKRHKDTSWTASLDRIDSSKGYIEGNVLWVHKDINMIKRTYSQKYIVYLCNIIAKENE